MKHWPDGVHEFLIAATDVNARKAAHNLQKNVLSTPGIDFCRKLEFKLIHNILDEKNGECC